MGAEPAVHTTSRVGSPVSETGRPAMWKLPISATERTSARAASVIMASAATANTNATMRMCILLDEVEPTIWPIVPLPTCPQTGILAAQRDEGTSPWRMPSSARPLVALRLAGARLRPFRAHVHLDRPPRAAQHPRHDCLARQLEGRVRGDQVRRDPLPDRDAGDVDRLSAAARGW